MNRPETLDEMMPSLQPLRFEGEYLLARWNQLKLNRKYGDEIKPTSRIGRLLVVLYDEADWAERELKLSDVATLPDFDGLTVEEMIESAEMEAEMLAVEEREQRKKLSFANFKKSVISVMVSKFIWDTRPATPYADGLSMFNAIARVGEIAYESVENTSAIDDDEKDDLNLIIFATQRYLFMDFDDRWDIRKTRRGDTRGR